MIPLIVDLETEWRGGQNQALLLLKGLYERGHAAELVATKGSSLSHRALKANVCVHLVSRGMLQLPATAKIWNTLQSGRVDLVHANEAHAVTAAWLARVSSKVPFVISRRVGYPLGNSAIAQSRYRAASCIIANSQWVASQAVASGALQEKLRVVYEGVQIPERTALEARRLARHRWGITDDAPLLGCVGVFLPDKGQEWLIRALAELRKEFSDARLLLAGNGPMRGELEALARTLRLDNAVIFAGFVKEVENVYAALDVFLLPSFFEALNNSLLAAMAYGVPSIAFRRGALPEIIEDGKSGLIVSGPEVREICETTAHILRDSNFARRLGEAGRTRVAEKFSADHMVEKTAEIYDELLRARTAI
jgi:glycosyltransferase involved in cell wall biosynthesis